MPVMDEFKEEREAIKNGSFQDKLKYFWCYYKWHTIVTICAVILLAVLIHDVTTQKETAFFAVMLNSVSLEEEDVESFQQSFVDYAQIDLDQQEVLFDNTISFSPDSADEMSVASAQRLLVYTAASELDVIVGGSDIFPKEANQGMFHDLRDVLSEEQLTKYEPYFYYIDQSYVDALEEAENNLEADITLPEIPDPTKPEEMENPIPVGIFVTDCANLKDTYYFGGEYSTVGIMVNAPHLENSLKFIDYLFE